MAQRFSGGCFCGAVRFGLTGAPVATRMCWCRDCQYLAAGNASVNAIFRTAGFTVEGVLAEFVSTADSGSVMRRRFCPRCGTQLFSEAQSRPNLIVVRVGALDDPAAVRPSMAIWTASAPDWSAIPDGLPCVAGQPGPVSAD